jgi:hypothetical protein
LNPLRISDKTEYRIWKAQVEDDEKGLRVMFADYFRDQGERIASQLALHWPVQKADSPADELVQRVFDLSQENGELRATLVPRAERLLLDYGKGLLESKQLDIPFLPTHPGVREFMEGFGASQVRHINETTQELLRDQLTEALEAGDGIKAVLSRINEVFDGDISVSRAQRIARTEIVTLGNNGRLEAARQSGVLKKKRWISEQLGTTRSTHAAMHGVEVELDQPFMVRSRKGIDKMQCPGDPSASAENVVNCLCVASYTTGRGDFDDITSKSTLG